MNKIDSAQARERRTATEQLATADVSVEPRTERRIVIVEDDALMRQALVEALEGTGYRAFATGRGAHVLDGLDQLRPDLILLDMLLPEMDGFEFLARLRNHPIGTRIPVIILSNLAESLIDCIDPDAARTMGVAAILSKSIPLPLLLEHVGRLPWRPRPSEAR